MIKKTATILIIGVSLVLAGCSSPSAPTPSTTTTSVPAAGPAPPASTMPAGAAPASPLLPPSPAGSDACQVSCGDNPQYNGPKNLPKPSWAPGDKQAALTAAHGVMDAYIKPGTDHAIWLAGIRPRITDQFAIELRKFNPTYLTVSKITGNATATTQADNAFQVNVEIPTDDGKYQVRILRSTQKAPWLANTITPPLPGNK